MKIIRSNISFYKKRRILKLIMKCYLFLFCTVVFGITPNYINSQNAKVHVPVSKVATMDEIFDLIMSQTDYTFIYHVDLLKNYPSVSIKKGTLTVGDLLRLGLSKGSFNIEFTDSKTIVINKKALIQKTVEGKVTDNNGLPIPGVNVIIKGHKSGVITDFDGKYKIDANTNDVLVFSYLGYADQEIPVQDKIVINVLLVQSVNKLNEIVLVSTGYQKVTQEKSTGSLVAITKEQLEKPAANISERLIGMVAGLQSTQNADGSIAFEIRGQTSLYADKAPLIVVDGFPVQDGFNTVNPNDVESITVLKDAAASAIWGAKSANGVIVITTKKGKAGKTSVAVSSFLRVSKKLDLDYVLGRASSKQTLEYEQKAFDTDFFESPFGGPPPNSPNAIAPFSQAITAMNEARLGRITSYERDAILSNLASLDNKKQIEDNLLQTPMVKQYNVSISGGSEKMTNNLSLLFQDSDTYFQGDNNKQYLINYGTNLKVNKKLKFDFSAMMQYNDVDKNSGQKDPIYGTGDMLSLIKTLNPWDMLKNSDGSLADMSYLEYYKPNFDAYVPKSDFPYSDWSYNPITEIKNRELNTKQLNTRIQAGLTLDIIDGLSISSRIQYELFNSKSSNYYNDKTFEVRQFVNETSGPQWMDGEIPIQLVPKGGILEQGQMDITGYNFRNQINFNKTYAGKHDIDFIGGVELNNKILETNTSPTVFGYNKQTLQSSPLLGDYRTSAMWNYFPAQYAEYFYNFSVIPNSVFTENTTRFFSVYGNLTYTFNNKYSVSGSYRTDASNIISDDPKFRYNPFYSVGFGWQVGKEKFLAAALWLDRLHIRGNYGVNGNIDRSTSFKPLINLNASVDPVTLESTATISKFGNPTLRWEKTATYNLGIDFSIFKSVLYGSVDLYNKNGYDLIINQSISAVNGTENQKFNNGEMNNKGLEIALGTRMSIDNNLSWSSTATFAYNKSKITSLFRSNYASYELSSGPTTSYVQGHNPNTLWSYQYAGLSNVGTQANPVMIPTVVGDNGTKAPITNFVAGDARNYMQDQGTLVAPYTLGWRNSFKIYQFDLSFIITAKWGHVFRRQGFNYSPLAKGNSVVNDKYDEVVNGDPNKIIPIPSAEQRYYFYNRFYPFMDYLTADASHIRFQEINLSYSLPSQVIKSVGIDSFRLFCQVNNMGTILFNDFNEDPEYSKGTIRPQATFTVGMQLNF